MKVLALLTLCAAVAYATVSYHSLPTTVPTVTVTSANTPADPALTSFRIVPNTVAVDQPFFVEAFVSNCAGCQVRVYLVSDNFDASRETGLFAANSLILQASLYPENGGYNYTMPGFTEAHMGGFWQAFVALTTNDFSRFYTFQQLQTAFPVASGVTFGNTPLTNWVTVTGFLASQTAITSDTQGFEIGIRGTLDASVTLQSTNIQCLLDGNEYVQLKTFSGVTFDTDGWLNFTGLTIDDDFTHTSEDVQAGVYRCRVTFYSNTYGLAPITVPNTFLANLALSVTSLTLSGADFSYDAIPPNCTFSVTASGVTTVNTAAALGITISCDENTDRAGAMMSVAGGRALNGFPTLVDSGAQSILYQIPQSSPAGMYSLVGVFVKDLSGNVAIYSAGGAQPFPNLNVFYLQLDQLAIEMLIANSNYFIDADGGAGSAASTVTVTVAHGVWLLAMLLAVAAWMQ